LVSNFNLTIFILGAEIHPLSHMLKLVRARTLHLQRVVNANPYKETSSTLTQVQDMARRLAELESHAAAGLVSASGQSSNCIVEPGKQPVQHNAALIREVRNALQPELDALNRAVRRYEKKATVLAFQTESRLGAIDMRLNDAISLAASAAKNSASQDSFLGWLTERATALAMMPVRAVLKVVTLPFRAITSVVRRDNGEFSEKGLRDRRTGKGGSSGRLSSSDRVPSRLSKR
jgi:type VI protein secretion system component VasK